MYGEGMYGECQIWMDYIRRVMHDIVILGESEE